VNDARDRQSVFRHVIDDGVSSGDRKPRLGCFLRTAAEDLLQRLERKLIGGKGGDGEPEDRRGAHRVDVGDGVRRGDGAEEVGVVDDRREEIDRLRNRNIAGDANNRRVVVGAVTDDKIPQPFLGREF
jgi:hypothetical protein